MIRGYLATPEALRNAASLLLNQDPVLENNFKELFVDSLKKYSTGYFNPWDDTGDEENLYTDDYTIFKFNTADNKKRLHRHLTDSYAREKLTEYNWLEDNLPKEIEYKINSSGFRCNNFNSDPGIVYVGCSHTYGTGMQLERTWPSIVSNYFNLESWNLGTPGLSISPGTFYLLNWASEISNPKAIVVLDSPPGRSELYTLKNNRLTISLLKNMLENVESSIFVNKLYQAMLTTSAIKQIHDTQSLKLLADSLKVPFINIKTADIIKSIEEIDFARDLMHFGANVHDRIASYVIHQLKNAGL